MAITEYNPTWQQGDDLTFGLIWEENDVVVDFTDPDRTDELRMDIVSDEGERLYTFNSDTIADADPVEDGAQPDTTTEVTFGSEGQINIVVDRAVTLPGGSVYDQLAEGVTLFNYDIFLRTNGRQKKILKGQITVDQSWTLWA